MLTNVAAPYRSWTLADSFHEGRTPTRGHEATVEAAMQAFAKLAQGISRRRSPQAPLPHGFVRRCSSPTSTAALEIIQARTTACSSLRWRLAVPSYLIRFHPEKARARRMVSALFVLSKKGRKKEAAGTP